MRAFQSIALLACCTLALAEVPQEWDIWSRNVQRQLLQTAGSPTGAPPPPVAPADVQREVNAFVKSYTTTGATPGTPTDTNNTATQEYQSFDYGTATSTFAIVASEYLVQAAQLANNNTAKQLGLNSIQQQLKMYPGSEDAVLPAAVKTVATALNLLQGYTNPRGPKPSAALVAAVQGAIDTLRTLAGIAANERMQNLAQPYRAAANRAMQCLTQATNGNYKANCFEYYATPS